MSGGGSADPPPPQWPNGGEFLLSLLCNPTNAHLHRPPHHHGDHSHHNPSSAQHHPFPSQPVPLDPAVAAVGTAIVPSSVHDRASAPWPPQAVSPPSQRPPPHLIYPPHFTAHPPGPDPNQQFADPGGDFRRGDSGRTGFIDSRLPRQFQQKDLSVGSLGFGPVDGISSESLGFQGNRERQVMLSGTHHRDHVNSHQESRKSNLQGSSSMNKGFSTPLGYLHRNEVDSSERENQIYGNVHRMMSAVAVDRVIGGRGEREFGGQRMGYGFEGSGEKRGARPRNNYRERYDDDSMYRNGSGDVHLFQQLDRPGLPSGNVVHSVSPAQAEFLGEVGDGASGKNNGGQSEKAEGLDDLEERFNGIAVGKDEVDPEKEKKLSRHLRDKDFRSDPRGQQILSQKARAYKRFMQCRWDIDRLIIPLFALYESLIPTEEEKVKQKQLLTLLEKLVNKEWPEANLYLYGSCGNSFGVRNSDIDVCIEIQNGDIDKSELLLKLADILQADNLQDVKALTRARVPIVKLMDPVTGISCDICVNNMLAVVNTKLLRDYAQIDVRLRQLAYVVKHWAKSRAVNETYQGTLSSYAYVLMCIHFLQQRRPPILPCLQELDPTYTVKVDDIRCAYFDQVEKLTNFGSRNKESIAQLAWAFFNYWAYGHDYTNTVISVRTGHLLSKQSKDWTRRIGNDRHLICIEDPFDTSHDLGRVVDKFSIRVLKEEFERAANIMQHDPNPCVSLFEPYIAPTPLLVNSPTNKGSTSAHNIPW